MSAVRLDEQTPTARRFTDRHPRHLYLVEPDDDVDIFASPIVTGAPVAPQVERRTTDPLGRLIDLWVDVACRHARIRQADDVYVADVAGVDGAWADGDTEDEALHALPDVLREWVRLKLDDGDRDIPDMEGVRLVPPE